MDSCAKESLLVDVYRRVLARVAGALSSDVRSRGIEPAFGYFAKPTSSGCLGTDDASCPVGRAEAAAEGHPWEDVIVELEMSSTPSCLL